MVALFVISEVGTLLKPRLRLRDFTTSLSDTLIPVSYSRPLVLC